MLVFIRSISSNGFKFFFLKIKLLQTVNTRFCFKRISRPSKDHLSRISGPLNIEELMADMSSKDQGFTEKRLCNPAELGLEKMRNFPSSFIANIFYF